MPVALYRGDTVSQAKPTPRGHPGVFFYGYADLPKTRGYATWGGASGRVRKVILTDSQFRKLANLNDDKLYGKLLPNKDDRSQKTSRGTMPSRKLCDALRAMGYIGFKWRNSTSGVEYFILEDFCTKLRYERLDAEERGRSYSIEVKRLTSSRRRGY
jgi:hypothetical protein